MPKLVLWLVVFCSLHAVSALTAQSSPALEWQRSATGDFCDEGPSWDVLPCGEYGAFRFRLAENAEKAGTSSASSASSASPCRIPTEGGLGHADMISAPTQARSPEAWTPCLDGSCFEPAGSVPPWPWIAVVDWNHAHGWSVGETILNAANDWMSVKLYPLDEPGVSSIDGLVEFVGEQVTDVHVLTQLCAVARDAQVRPPLILNMSFGLSTDGPPDCPGSSPSLRCQTVELLQMLRDQYDISQVASAGNHGSQLFPANVRGVISVGAMALSNPGFWQKRTVDTPWEVDVLFPSHALFLERPDGEEVWPVPPGSSYSAAFFSGWHGTHRAVNIGYQNNLESWVEQGHSDWNGLGVVGFAYSEEITSYLESWGISDNYYLRYKDFPLPASSMTNWGKSRQLMRTASGERPLVCRRLTHSLSDPGSSHTFSLEPFTGVRTTSAFSSVVELQASAFLPSPDSEPCVPCVLHRRRRRAAGDQVLVLDLMASNGVADGTRVLEVRVEIGAQTYRLAGPTYDRFVEQFNAGTVAEIVIEDYPEPGNDEQVTLRYQMLRDVDQESFWDSSPVAWHDDDDPYLLSMSDDFESGTVAAWSVVWPVAP
jgi:hypothetical protein